MTTVPASEIAAADIELTMDHLVVLAAQRHQIFVRFTGYPGTLTVLGHALVAGVV
ncbi:hypothetical protein [Kocuria coralli]|uniref:hypothetical protein n=1 Tax=Kocuria coralli TaxID=1461025 RepID=UPI0015F2E3CA|nr:hypothetical protein [Kocuria coralli]